MRIGTVPYYNCLPLVSALESNRLALPPSQLGKALQDGEVDVALMPVFSIIKHGFHAYPEAGVIGCDGAVGSVAFYTKYGVSIEDASSIYFDDESRTSVALGKILLNKLYQRNLKSLTPATLDNVHEADAQMLIGDKALFFQENGYRCHDLGDLWKRLTRQGFVFACWASKDRLDKKDITRLTEAREQGLKHLDKLAEPLPPRRREKIITYLTRHIIYEMTPSLQNGWDLYARYLDELNLLEDTASIDLSLPLFPEEFLSAMV